MSTHKFPPFHVVGIGASAGGLEALETFFDNTPMSNDLAFVVIQHLSPDYKSLMGELLEKHTPMTVKYAEDGMLLSPGTVHLIPRKKNLRIYQGKLFLTEQENRLNLPIDIFFQSLAEDCGEHAVGIILSGTGSDGTRGVRAIKEVGGLVITQDEEDAKFDGMPRSAISTGIVDYVLPAHQIPRRLTEYVSGTVTILPPDTEQPLHTTALAKIFMLIKQKTGVDLAYYKQSTILRRIERRMNINQISTIDDYVAYLEESPAEISTVFKEILIGVTKFFRDTDAFAALQSLVVPRTFEGKNPDDPFRVWVAGCSTGEEAYSIAIMIDEYAQRNNLPNNFKIFATDIDKDALEFASYGVYPESIAADTQPAHLERYFIPKGDSYQISPEIRERVVFAYHNVFRDPPFRTIDIVSCRNLLIYLQPVLQKQVLSNFVFSLNPAGHLFLGSSESLGELTTHFQVIDTKWKIFRRRSDRKPPSITFIPPDSSGSTGTAVPGFRKNYHQHMSRETGQMYERLLDAYLPPTAIIDEGRRIEHIFGDLTPYLRIPTGKVDLDLLKMAVDDLELPLGNAIQQATQRGAPFSYDNIAVTGSDGQPHAITLTVFPLSKQMEHSNLAVVFAPQTTDTGSTPVVPTQFHIEESVQQRIGSLESELQYTKENLQATIEELETSNEELQATNEELLSSNEELQSTNEELQSVNEELITVNSEYQKKIDELSELNDDISNLLESSAFGTIFLDNQLRIRKFTPPVTRQINIIKTDIGRPFNHISHNLRHEGLYDEIVAVTKSGNATAFEVQHIDGSWLLVKINPYLHEHLNPNGVIISLIDITDRKSAEEALLRNHELLMRIMNSNPSAVVMVDLDGRVIYANDHSRSILQIPQETLEGRHSSHLSLVHEGKELLFGRLPFLEEQTGGGAYNPITAELMITRNGHTRTITARLNGSAIYDDTGEMEGAVVNIEAIDP